MISPWQTRMIADGVVPALTKLVAVESVQVHRLLSDCLANLTTSREVTWELLHADGHQVSLS